MPMNADHLDMTPIITIVTTEKSARKFTRWQEDFFRRLGMKSTTSTEPMLDGRTKVITTPLLS